jgi:hypothetical protein
MFAAENRSMRQHLGVRIEVESFVNFTNSRSPDMMFVEGGVNPLCRQFLVAYTCRIAEQPASIKFKFNFSTENELQQHIPAITSKDMHCPFLIPGAREEARAALKREERCCGCTLL